MAGLHYTKAPNYNLNRLGVKYFRRQIDKKMFEDIVSSLVNRAEEQFTHRDIHQVYTYIYFLNKNGYILLKSGYFPIRFSPYSARSFTQI